MGDYKYPAWGEALGFMISLSSMLWVPGKNQDHLLSIIFNEYDSWRKSFDTNLKEQHAPGYAIYFFFTTRGTWQEVLRLGVTPVIKARPEALLAEIKYNAARAGELKDVELSLLDPPAPEAVPGSAEKRSKLLSQELGDEEEEERSSSRGGRTSIVDEEVEDAPPAYCVE